MIDGLKQEQLLVGSGFIDFVSGTGLAVASSEVGAAEIASNAVTLVKISAAAVDGDQGTLDSGSRWVTFRSAFAAPPFVVASYDLNARTASQSNDGLWVNVGSVAAGSFLAVGSPATFVFRWIAIGSR